MSSSNLPFVFAIAVSLGMIHTAIAQNSPEDFVSPHNSARAAVGVGPVSWNDSVAAYAQDYANQRSGDCQLVHSDGSYGENLFGGSGADYTAADAVNLWMSEKHTTAKGGVADHFLPMLLNCADLPTLLKGVVIQRRLKAS
uniref:Pathogenesis-related protein PRB1-3-like n=1 Tax=Elaeis guineensis var. tenera TaxID=51953 RepID=A0A6I9SIL7_ELAGV|nr:pathogenesis-related protein PRB1-3-like [Elaeis guineensis]